ncbi:hypothetical protein PWT90_08363 [Aphanocladium album]|nr:hypothetical protein PWT90_08363 [Aphanocladium album]
MADHLEPEIISMELSTSGRDDCHFRIRAGPLVKYVTVTAGALDAFTLLDMPVDFATILPPLDYRSQDWNQARVERSANTKELAATLSQTSLAAVTSTWHPVKLDMLALAKLEDLGLLEGEYLWNRDDGAKMTVVAKMARFPWEIAAIDAETQVYERLAGKNIGPTFLGHVQENGRVVGFALEMIHGRRHARPDDLASCQAALRQLHSHGVSHGSLSSHHFLVNDEDGSAVVIDFAAANAAAGEEELAAEYDGLALGLAEESDGSDGFDEVIYEEDEDGDE